MNKSFIFSMDAQHKGSLVYPSLTGTQTIYHLGEVDGRHYIAVPEGVNLGLQPAVLDIRSEELVSGPVRDALKKTCLEYRTINDKIKAAIRSRYSVEDELQALREGDEAYQQFVKTVISSFAAEKALLGF